MERIAFDRTVRQVSETSIDSGNESPGFNSCGLWNKYP
ncbi:MAG: hypothetical protein QG650_813 [Patescibacteria group bacterium]|nr:hypothetical protein [Patescibacteria group bacterium]